MISREKRPELREGFRKRRVDSRILLPGKHGVRKFGMLIAAVLMAAGLFAQTITSSITGKVTDPSGAVVPGASVTVSDRALGITQITVTNSTGSYLTPALPAGTYDVTVTARGFKTYRAMGVVLNAAQKIRADVVLQVGAVTTQVTVSGSTIGQVQTQTSQLGGTVTGKQLTQLELNGRNFSQLITLVPGVSNQTGQDEGTVGVNGSTAYSVNGGRTVYNNWEVDGVSMMDLGSGSNIVVTYPSIDAIAEERVLTSNYGAQYGQSSSGTVVAVLKSGTSQFHGDGYEFNRNELFNARNFFDTGRGSYKKNDWGYTFGGPFYIPGHYNTNKTKTFFFWSQEWRKEISPATFDSQVPSTGERQGDFSDVCPNPSNGNSMVDCPVDPATGTFFPGNQVPISAAAQDMMAMIPAPNAGSGALSFLRSTPSYPTTWREELVRVDQNITPNVRMMVHYIHDSWSTVNATTLWSTASFPTINTDFAGPGTSFVAQLSASASPTLLNEFIFGYSADHIILSNVGAWKLPANFGMKSLFPNNFGGKLPGLGSVCCNTELGSGGFGEDAGFINPADPNYNANPIYTFRDLLTKIAGNHNLTFGADVIIYQKNEQNGGTPSNNGNLTFSTSSGVTTGNAWADFLTGRIGQFQQLSSLLKYYNRYKTFSPYVEDDWHVRKGLTLNLGFRADFFQTFHNKYQLESSFDPAAFVPANAPEIDVDGSITGQAGALVPGIGNPFNGLITCGKGGAPSGCLKGHLFNPAPRIGFAWDPTGHGATAIRGGYGIFYDHMNGNEVGTESLEGSPPLALSPSVYNIVGYQNVGGTELNFPLSVKALEGAMRWPYAQQWNLDVQHNFGKNTMVSVAYVGSKGTHLTDQRDLNQLHPVPDSENPFAPGQPITATNCGPPLVGPNGQPVTGQAAINLGVACGNDPNPYRPFIGYNNITVLETGANSDYNALQVYARKTLGRLHFSLAYTYSHSLDDSSDRYDGIFVNSYNLKRGYASSNFDETHILNASYVYDFPFFQHRSSRFLRDTIGGWEISGITSFQTGTPFTVVNGGLAGIAGDAAGVGNGVGVGSYPDICGNINAAPPVTNVAGIIGPLLYNPGAFCAPRGLTFGNAGRNILRNPHYVNWNVGLFKDIPISGERVHLQFRAEAFNLFNTANLEISESTSGVGAAAETGCYGGPNNSAGAPGCIASTGFLQANGAHNPRILQLGLKLLF